MALTFKGSAWFRQRIICATLSGRTMAIKDIRAKDEKPGLLGTLRTTQFNGIGCRMPPSKDAFVDLYSDSEILDYWLSYNLWLMQIMKLVYYVW